jgi:hypothetical protein
VPGPEAPPAHEVLGIGPGASREEITEAFRRYARHHHPDRGGDASRFQAGVDAYRRLTGARTLRPAAPHVVFHRRARPAVPTLLRVAGRRLAAFRPHQ